jgi:autotransporter translocation and assembly factor TamB
MKTLRTLSAACLAASVLALAAYAADLTGDWKWTSQSASGAVQMTAKLVQKDGALTGTVTGRQGPAEIADASLKGGVVAFSVTRSSGGKTMVIKYEGKIEGDTITGTIERPGPNGAAPTKTEWKASRGKP